MRCVDGLAPLTDCDDQLHTVPLKMEGEIA